MKDTCSVTAPMLPKRKVQRVFQVDGNANTRVLGPANRLLEGKREEKNQENEELRKATIVMTAVAVGIYCETQFSIGICSVCRSKSNLQPGANLSVVKWKAERCTPKHCHVCGMVALF